MPQDRVAIVSQQSQFYRNGFRKLLIFTYILLGLCYLLLGVIVYQHFIRPVPQYFVTTTDGSLIEIKPINES